MVVEDGLAQRRVGIQQAVHAAGVHGETDGRRNARSQRSGRDLHALRVSVLGVAGRERARGAQLLDVLQLEAEAREVELNVLGEGRVPRR